MVKFVSEEEYNHLTGRSDLLDSVTRRAETLGAENVELRMALDGLREAVEVQTAVEDRLAALKSGVHITNVRELAVEELAAEARTSHDANIRKQVQEEERARVFDRVLVEEGPGMRRDYMELFATDGTFARIAEESRTAVRQRMADEVRQAAREAAEAEASSPEAQAAYRATIAEEVTTDPEVVNYSSELRAKHHAQWRQEAIQEAKDAAAASVRAQEDEIKAQAAAEYRESSDGRAALAKITRDAERAAERLGIDELLKQSRNDALRDALDGQAELKAQAIGRENTANELKKAFDGEGINTDDMPAGVTLEIALGDITRSKDHYSNVTTIAEIKRVLSLTSVGDGKYRVSNDTLANSKNLYAQRTAIPEGTIITIGIRATEITEDTKDDPHTLLPILRLATTLEYDIDTTTPSEFDSTHLKVANVSINGITAMTINSERQNLL